MSPHLIASTGWRRTWIATLGLAAVVTLASTLPAPAQSLSREQIIKALEHRPARAPDPDAGKQREARLNEIIGSRSRKRGFKRAFSAKERTEIYDIARERPSVDLEIYFDFNSAEVSPRAKPTLENLGRALVSGALKASKFMIAGHTDAIGGTDYNLELSQRRAEAVRRYLVGRFNIEPDRLEAIGYGKEKLKLPAAPLDGVNRRVQVVNLSE